MNPSPDHHPGPHPATDPAAGPLTWTTWREALVVLTQPRLLRRTTTIAALVGTILFAINQLDVVLHGDANTVLWIKSAVTYLVPFCVSCAGVLAATRQPPPSPTDGRDSAGNQSEAT